MFREIAKAIKNAKGVLIFPHKSADGDCLGSAFALKLMLEQLGKKANVLLEEENPKICKILFGTAQSRLKEYDTAIAVDCGDIMRLGSRYATFAKCPQTINIDHHNTNTRFAQYNYVDANGAATGEILFELLEYMNITLTQQIANNLYTAISSDTGRFSYTCATAKTYRIAAALLETGINHAYINNVLFEINSMSKIRLMRDAYNSFETLYDDRVAMVSVTKQQVLQSGSNEEDAGGLINIPRSLETALIAVSLRESIYEDNVKVGFRSESINVAQIASNLGGGGHIRASGCIIKGDIKTAKAAVLKEIEKAL